MARDDGMRIGHSERIAALEQLAAHHEAGRLDAHEYEDRRGRANDAVTKGDLVALFTDLPSLGTDALSSAQAPPNRWTQPPPEPADVSSPARRKRSRRNERLVALSVFVALAGFLLFRTWVFWMLIPVTAVALELLDRDV